MSRRPAFRRGSVYAPGPGLARPIAYAAGALLFALCAFLIYGKVCGGADCSGQYCKSNRTIAPPPGYQLVTDIYQRNKKAPEQPPGSMVQVLFPLREPTTDGRNLSFYRYVEETKAWEPAAAAVLDPQGRAVTASLQDVPGVLAVLKREAPAGHMVSYLPHNAQPHPESAGRVTILHTLDFQPAADGTIQGDLSSIKPEPQTAWYPTISATAAEKTNVFVEAALANATSRSAHVRQVVKRVGDAKLAGIDIAYFDLRADQRTSFALFIGELGQLLHAEGKVLSVTLPCPIRTRDRIDEGAYDWAEVGKAADIVQMAPCRDQSTFRRDMPAILDYLLTIVPANKLVLTVTPYATEKSAEGVRRLTIVDAMRIALDLQVSAQGNRLVTNSNVTIVGTNIDRDENLTGITWDAAAACVAFTHKSDGNRTVWLENFFSVGFKLEFVSRYRLGGVAIEDGSADPYLGNIWPALVPFVSTGQPILLQPNGSDLIPKWTVNKGSLEPGQPGKGSVTWLTPADPGTALITLTLSDGVSVFQNEVSVNVTQRDPRSPAASPTAN